MAIEATRAVVCLADEPSEATKLKRLALLFDEIHVLRPIGTVISRDALADTSRFEIDAEGILHVKDFNYFRDAEHGYHLLSLNQELDETLAALEEAQIAKDATKAAEDAGQEDGYVDLRGRLIAGDIEDEEWNRLTETTPDDYGLEKAIVRVEVKNLDTGGADTLWWFREPPSVAASDEIAFTSHFAASIGASPLFDDDLRKLLAYRYERFQEAIAANRASEVGDITGYRTHFGEVAFRVANSVFSSDSLEDRSIEEVISFREEMSIARTKFVSTDLGELSDLISGNPWGPESKNEVDRFVLRKLAGDVARFDASSISVWEKMYGSLVVRAGEIGKNAGFGGGLGGVVGNVVPHTSVWGMLLAGALAGASRQFPGAISDIAESIREQREQNRTGIAYIARYVAARPTNP